MPKIFTSEKRSEIRQNIMRISLELLESGGLKKMSIEEITKGVGISQGTFYNFFESKELLLCALAESYQKRITQDFDLFVEAHGSLKRKDLQAIYHNMIFKDQDNVYRYLKREDLTLLLTRLPCEHRSKLSASVAQIDRNLAFIAGKKDHVDSAAIINWIQIMHLVLENQDILIKPGLEKLVDTMIENMLDEIFEKVSERSLS